VLADQVLPAASAAGVGIIVRVPLASGLLSGRYTMDTVFSADDHRTYNTSAPKSTPAGKPPRRAGGLS
jgi:aryl-alcohol dehydrogenase-like predicted oxidoreductase